MHVHLVSVICNYHMRWGIYYSGCPYMGILTNGTITQHIHVGICVCCYLHRASHSGGHTCTLNPAECFRQCDRDRSTDSVHIPTGQQVGQVTASVGNIYDLSPLSPSSAQGCHSDPLGVNSPLSSSQQAVISDTVSRKGVLLLRCPGRSSL